MPCLCTKPLFLGVLVSNKLYGTFHGSRHRVFAPVLWQAPFYASPEGQAGRRRLIHTDDPVRLPPYCKRQVVERYSCPVSWWEIHTAPLASGSGP